MLLATYLFLEAEHFEYGNTQRRHRVELFAHDQMRHMLFFVGVDAKKATNIKKSRQREMMSTSTAMFTNRFLASVVNSSRICRVECWEQLDARLVQAVVI